MSTTDLADLGEEQFVSLTTFRRTGVGVPTTVWTAADGDDLVVSTPGTSGKVKRVRRDGRVEITACSRRGRIAPDVVMHTGRAVIDDDTVGRARRALQAKYGLLFRIALATERLRRKENRGRVILRISPS